MATHAEIGLGTLYKHFTSKTSLLAAALHDDLERLFKEAEVSIPKQDTLLEQLLHLAGFNYKYYTSRPRLSREYLKHIAFMEGEWADKIAAFDQAFTETVSTLALAAQDRGEIPPDKDCRYIGLSLTADYFFVLAHLFFGKMRRCRTNACDAGKDDGPDPGLKTLPHIPEKETDR